MKRRSVERVRRTAPVGLLGMILLVATIERSVFRDNPAFLGPHAANWQYAADNAVHRARNRAILCFGDSLVKFGILPNVVRESTTKSAYNLAMSAAPAPATYYQLRHALDAGARPRAILVDYSELLQGDDAESKLLAQPWAELLTVGDAFDLSRTAQRPDLLTQVVLGQVFHSFKNRFEIRNRVLADLRSDVPLEPSVLAVLRRNWDANNGAQVQVKTSLAERPPKPENTPSECHPLFDSYVNRFLALAARRRIPIFWVVPPYAPRLKAELEHRGVAQRYTKFIETKLARFRNLVVIDGRNSPFDRSLFFDERHVDRDGAVVLSSAIGAILRDRWSRPSAEPRRIGLPSDLPRRPMVAVEDFERSRLMLLSDETRRR